MRKVLFHLSIFIITFAFGIISANFLLNQNTEKPQIAVEETFCPYIDAEVRDIHDEYLDGWYTLKNFEGMPEVFMISLTKDRFEFDKQGSSNEKFLSIAGVFTKLVNYSDESFFDSKTAEIENDKVYFVTNKIKGIEYRFNGTFFIKATTREKVLRGTLQKFVKGKKVAEVSGEFEYHKPPNCFR